MTAVFKKPLSETRKPLAVSFSSRSPGFFGAAMDLKAVADTVLLRILKKGYVLTGHHRKELNGVSRYAVHLSGTVIGDRQRFCEGTWV